MYRQDDRIGVNNAKESVYIIFMYNRFIIAQSLTSGVKQQLTSLFLLLCAIQFMYLHKKCNTFCIGRINQKTLKKPIAGEKIVENGKKIYI